MSDPERMSTVSVRFATLLRLNKLKKLRKSRDKHEPHMESLADVVERAVELLEREQGVNVC